MLLGCVRNGVAGYDRLFIYIYENVIFMFAGVCIVMNIIMMLHINC